MSADIEQKKAPVKVERTDLLAASHFNVVALGVVVVALSIVGFYIVVRSLSASTSLYLAPPSVVAAPGESLTVAIRLSSAEQVKIVRAILTYPADKFEFVGINANNSAFTVDAGAKGGEGSATITRTVATGKSVSGDQLVARVTLKAKNALGAANITFADGSAVIRANDNSNILFGTTGGSYTISGEPVSNTSTSTSPLDVVDDTGVLIADADKALAQPSILSIILIVLGVLGALAAAGWVGLRYILPWWRTRQQRTVVNDLGLLAKVNLAQSVATTAAVVPPLPAPPVVPAANAVLPSTPADLVNIMPSSVVPQAPNLVPPTNVTPLPPNPPFPSPAISPVVPPLVDSAPPANVVPQTLPPAVAVSRPVEPLPPKPQPAPPPLASLATTPTVQVPVVSAQASPAPVETKAKKPSTTKSNQAQPVSVTQAPSSALAAPVPAPAVTQTSQGPNLPTGDVSAVPAVQPPSTPPAAV